MVTIEAMEPKILDLFRHVTNGAECFSFAFFFSLFILIMLWQMQIFRRSFRLKEDKCIVDPSKVVRVHLLILVYLIIKITALGYALISGQIDYKRRKQYGIISMKVNYFNPIIYALLLNICTFSQVTAYVLTIQNWLWIIEGLVVEQHKLSRFFTKLSIPLLILTFVLQVIIVTLLFMDESQYIYLVAQTTIVLYILLINFMTISSWTIYKFFKSAYTDSQQLTRAIILVNIGLQIQGVLNLLNVISPIMMIGLKNYNPDTKTDTTIHFALIWSFEQLFGSIIPTIFIIILARPVLFLFVRSNSEQNQLYKSLKPNTDQSGSLSNLSLSKLSQSKSRSKLSKTSYSLNDESIQKKSSSHKNLAYVIRESSSFNSSDQEDSKRN